MWKKITAVTMICILCAFFSFRITDAAEVSGTKQDVTDYKQISALISDTWDDDYFEKMVITPGTDTMEKDGEEDRVSDTFDVSSSKAKSITKSEDVFSLVCPPFMMMFFVPNFLNFFEFPKTILPSFFLSIFPLLSSISLENSFINSSFLILSFKASCPMISASIYNAFNSFASNFEKELLPEQISPNIPITFFIINFEPE